MCDLSSSALPSEHLTNSGGHFCVEDWTDLKKFQVVF